MPPLLAQAGGRVQDGFRGGRDFHLRRGHWDLSQLSASLQSPVDILPVSNLHDQDQQYFVPNLIDSPIILTRSNIDSIEFLVRYQFLHPTGPGLIGKFANVAHDLLSDRWIQFPEVSGRRWRDVDAVEQKLGSEFLYEVVKRNSSFFLGLFQRLKSIGQIDPIHLFFGEAFQKPKVLYWDHCGNVFSVPGGDGPFLHLDGAGAFDTFRRVMIILSIRRQPTALHAYSGKFNGRVCQPLTRSFGHVTHDRLAASPNGSPRRRVITHSLAAARHQPSPFDSWKRGGLGRRRVRRAVGERKREQPIGLPPADRCWDALEAEAETEAEHAFVNAFATDAASGSDLHETAVGNVGNRRVEMRRVSEVEDLGAELEAEALREAE